VYAYDVRESQPEFQAIIMSGSVYEVHWDKTARDLDLYEATDFETDWLGIGGLIMVPPGPLLKAGVHPKEWTRFHSSHRMGKGKVRTGMQNADRLEKRISFGAGKDRYYRFIVEEQTFPDSLSAAFRLDSLLVKPPEPGPEASK
jgi:hypothetical protein